MCACVSVYARMQGVEAARRLERTPRGLHRCYTENPRSKSLTDLVLALLVLDPLQDVVDDAGAGGIVEEGVLVVDDETEGSEVEGSSVKAALCVFYYVCWRPPSGGGCRYSSG